MYSGTYFGFYNIWLALNSATGKCRLNKFCTILNEKIRFQNKFCLSFFILGIFMKKLVFFLWVWQEETMLGFKMQKVRTFWRNFAHFSFRDFYANIMASLAKLTMDSNQNFFTFKSSEGDDVQMMPTIMKRSNNDSR